MGDESVEGSAGEEGPSWAGGENRGEDGEEVGEGLGGSVEGTKEEEREVRTDGECRGGSED